MTPAIGVVFTATISGITGSGTLGLNLVNDGSILSLAGVHSARRQAPSNSTRSKSTLLVEASTAAVLTDVTGDGKTDIVVANTGINTVSVMLGNGNGTFQTQQSFAAGDRPYSVAVGDLTGDGKPDLIVANVGPTYYPLRSSVSVLLGNGNGTFQAEQTFAVGQRADSVAIGDLTGDGKLDIVVANFSDDLLSVLLSNGNGTFQVQHTIATGVDPYSVVLADLTGDGKLDMAVANRGFDAVGVLLGNGNGTFQAARLRSWRLPSFSRGGRCQWRR